MIVVREDGAFVREDGVVVVREDGVIIMPHSPRTRVLAADDSALMRRKLREIIEGDPELELIGVARDGEDVVQKALELRPDVVSMDIHMPKLDGISALQILVAENICPVVMLSSLTKERAVTTFEALELGAFDYVAKPDGTVSNLAEVAAELRVKLKTAGTRGTLERLRRNRNLGLIPHSPTRSTVALPSPREGAAGRGESKAVAIGISTGGPATIMEVLPHLPADMNGVVFLVQHMPASFTGAFAKRLDSACAIRVLEAEAGMEVRLGHCYVARGDLQMTVHRTSSGRVMLQTPVGPETLFRPSVNVMMESVLGIFGRNTIGVLMTGIGDDGADQMVRIRSAGGHTIAESRDSAVVFGMPRVAIERGGADEIRASGEIARAILRRL